MGIWLDFSSFRFFSKSTIVFLSWWILACMPNPGKESHDAGKNEAHEKEQERPEKQG